ncbi:MAG: response regulator transcription factor [Pseudomonadota bacterium]
MTDTMPHLLLVDDEPSIHEPLSDYLTQNGYKVSVAERAGAAREVLQAQDIDLLLLDVMMPGEDGLSLMRDIQTERGLPIILLTAKAEETDKIVGLELGADDYVTKPFNPRELLARIRALLRRVHPLSATEEAHVYQFAGFRLNERRRRLQDKAGEEIILTGGEYALLLALVMQSNHVLSRDQLLDATQGREAGVFDRSIDNQISRLRKKIEPDPRTPTLIKTVRGGGYVLSAQVVRA